MSDEPNYREGPDDAAGIVAACRALHSAVDALDAKAAKALAVSRNDLRCLHLLENGPVSPTQIGKALDLTSGSVTVLLDRLERKDFVRRRPSPHDRRALLVEATPRVWQSLAALYRPFGEALVNLSESYGTERARDAAQHLEDVAERCREQL
ncbi:MarR family transcriptional regulator [Blastomonas sp. UPD001]|uniref:MarR family transcriptional regulator n=1 Tax=Blastomonas sp. UPD001 TaxID=2217673 RepID=UPI000E3579C1|nr:MarR family transcriptional regulator [Blastomonas sp. UPD001]